MSPASDAPLGAALLDAAVHALAATERLLVCCDYDGTLSPIVSDPMAAVPLPGTVEVLTSVGDLADTEAAVVSGRGLAVLAQLSQLPSSVTLVGSHGAEFSDDFVASFSDDQTRLRAELASRCHELADRVPGAHVEEKPASVAVHVRNADRAQAQLLLQQVEQGPGQLAGVHLMHGKEVLELSVASTDKGTALLALRERFGATGVFFAGDDITDERGFGVLDPADVGVKVGATETVAQHRVADPEELLAVLERLLIERRRQLNAR